MIIAIIGTLIATGVVLYIIVGLAIDIKNLDQTSGGYEPPYEGWTGTPVDWDAMAKTPEGFSNRGVVADTCVNCTTGMISFRIFHLLRVDWQPFSDRALVVHKPREACQRHGFTPEF